MTTLKTQRCWVGWKYNEDKKKIPYNPATLKPARINQMSNLVLYSEARANLGQFDGLGFVLTGNLVVIDIDGKEGHSEENPLAKEILNEFSSYAELSPSGHGYHIVMTCDISRIPTEKGNDGKLRLSSSYYQKNDSLGLEIYFAPLTSRYFTYTGKKVSEECKILDQTSEIIDFLNKYMKKPQLSGPSEAHPLADADTTLDQILDVARTALDGAKFKALYDLGDMSAYNNDHSSADLALCRKLAYYLQGDSAKIDQAFRASALYREKWERQDYREATISKAIAYVGSDFYSPGNQVSETLDLRQFHKFDDNGRLRDVLDDKVFHYILEHEHMFIMGSTPYIYKCGRYVRDDNGVMLKSKIRKLIFPEKISSNVIDRIFRLFYTVPELIKTMDEINSYPESWINFKNAFFDPVKNILIPHSHEYLSINQIPFSYDPAVDYSGKKLENWLKFSVPSAKDRKMLFEFSGLCFGRESSIQKFLIIEGQGGTGKSLLLRLIQEAVGKGNYSNVSLECFQHRFSTFPLIGKTLNSSADLKLDSLDDVSMIKKIIGQDTIMAESKGKDAVFFKSYAKLIFSTNELPLIKREKTDAFYRRLLILTMKRKPEKVMPNLFYELKEELPFFISLSMSALHDLYLRGEIYESPNSIFSVARLRNSSDNTEAFISTCTVLKPGSRLPRTAVFEAYDSFCKMYELSPMSRTDFYASLKAKGIRYPKVNGTVYCDGLILK